MTRSAMGISIYPIHPIEMGLQDSQLWVIVSSPKSDPKLDNEIRRLCAAAASTTNAHKLEIALAELRAALNEHEIGVQAMAIQ